MRRSAALISAAMFLLIAVSMSAAAEQMTLTSATLEYDPSSGIVKAAGNVRITGRGSEITAGFGEFDAEGRRSHFREKVFADWGKGSLTMDCGDLVLVEEQVGQRLTARSVKRFNDAARNISMSGDLMEGFIRGGEFLELVATGNVITDSADPVGEPSRVTSARAVYSREKGTIVFTGNAVAVQKSRKISADTFIIHIESGRMEAIGNPRMVVDLPPEGAQ